MQALPPTSPPPVPPGHQVAAYQGRPYNVWAIVSLCFGASTVIGTWCFGGLIAIITGHIARSQIKRSGEGGGTLALVGLIAGYVSIALFFAFVFVYVIFFVLIFAFAAAHPTPTPSPVVGG